MPYEIESTPTETADLSRSPHRAADASTRRKMISGAPLPVGCNVSLKNSRSEVLDQDRINLPQSVALSMDRVYGRVISIREERDSANTLTKASANVMLRIPFWDANAYAYRSVFVRSSAYFSNFAPRQPDQLSWNMVRGDLITGILQRPFIPPYLASLLNALFYLFAPNKHLFCPFH